MAEDSLTMQQTWEMLPKSQDDNSLITDAIGDAIADHNADVDAHLGTNESLQSHRAAEIIDHLAESVVNDKLKATARAYVAIVDADSVSDFDTIQGAVEHAIEQGGGTVLITPGEYYLSGVVDLNISVNLYAVDAEAVTIHGSITAGDYLRITDDTVTNQVQQFITNIKFVNDGGGVIKNQVASYVNTNTINFEYCTFDGGNRYIDCLGVDINITKSKFYISTNAALQLRGKLRLIDCMIYRYSTASTCVFAGFSGGDHTSNSIKADNCVFRVDGATTAKYFDDTDAFSVYLSDCLLIGWVWQNAAMYILKMVNCVASGDTNDILTFQSDGEPALVAYNTITAAGTGYITAVDTQYQFVGNYMTGALANIPNTIRYTLPREVLLYETKSTATTAMGMRDVEVAQLTPNSTRTLTTTVPRTGERRTIIILTSGTTSYTITFGTGFKPVGTLATGTTSARRFCINFISDGTFLIETGRTAAIA